VDVDGDPSTVDPLIITDGNMQIHISGCDFAVSLANTGTARLSPLPGGSDLADRVAWLAPATPNPAGRATAIRFNVPRATNVSLRVFDASGRVVRELVGGHLAAGRYATTWDLSDRSGHRVSRGVYFLRLAVEDKVVTRSMSVIR
jgi:hypothetical protein